MKTFVTSSSPLDDLVGAIAEKRKRDERNDNLPSIDV
jgi:hypothetical protein